MIDKCRYISVIAASVTGILLGAILFGGSLYAQQYIQNQPVVKTETTINLQNKSTGQLLALANRAYENESYEQALTIYQHIYDSAPAAQHDATFLYNFGNAQYKNNNLGLALTYYRRAQNKKPRDNEILDNIRLVKSKIIDKDTHQPSPLSNVLNTVSLNETWALFILCLTFMNGCFFIMRKKTKQEAFKHIFGISVALFLVSLCILGLKTNSVKHVKAVFIERKVTARSGPNDTLSPLFVVHEGTEGSITKQTSEWAQIELNNGFTGWVPTRTFLQY